MSESNPNSRLEAFCDGVFAIALTLLIIDIHIPSTTAIHNTDDFWRALSALSPSIYAFILSFAVILITWVNHHNILKLVPKTSSAFIYANGFLLLTVAFLPFPTALMGEYIFSDHAAPAVMLYNTTLALQSLSWILVFNAVFANKLADSEKAIVTLRQNRQYGYFAVALYSLCAVAALWFPLTIAIVTTIIWIFWLVLGITIKENLNS